MSGHSKFANIKHKKEKNDAAKGKIFTIIGREIAVAVKEGGPDTANNFKLAQVIAKARSTISRTIRSSAVSRRLLETATRSITNSVLMKATVRAEPPSS